MKNMLLLYVALLTSTLCTANPQLNTLEQAIIAQDQVKVSTILQEIDHLSLHNKRLMEEVAQDMITYFINAETLAANDNTRAGIISALFALLGLLFTTQKSPCSKTVGVGITAVSFSYLLRSLFSKESLKDAFKEKLDNADAILQLVKNTQTA